MQAWLLPALTLAIGGVGGWFIARSMNIPAVRMTERTANDALRDEIRAVLTDLKADCESMRRNIHTRMLVMDIGGGSLPTSIQDTSRLDEICSTLAGRLDDEWGQISGRVSSIRAVVFGLRACHVVAVLRDKKASLGFNHADQDYDDLTSKISEVIVRVEACLCALDHRK